jgi:hypothetical protein
MAAPPANDCRRLPSIAVSSTPETDDRTGSAAN